VALMSYNPLWQAKTHKIGFASPFARQKALTTWMDSMRLKHCRDLFINAGIEL
jgi:hypothetical protein